MRAIQVALGISCLALAAIPHTSSSQTGDGRETVDAALANKGIVSRFYAEAWMAGDLSVAEQQQCALERSCYGLP